MARAERATIPRYLWQHLPRTQDHAAPYDGAGYGHTRCKTLKKDSWISVDAHTLQAVADDRAAYALDATYGITLKHGKIMGQISTFQAFDDAQSISVTPAYAHRIGKSTRFEVGVVLRIRGKPDPTLKIGIWQKF